MKQQTSTKQNFALPIAIMFALFFMIAFVTGYQNPLGSVIEKMSEGNPIMSQLGTLANFIAYAFMGYPAGKLLQNKGFRVTALCAVSIGFVGVLITYMSGFIADASTAVAIYLIGAFVAGFSMCLLNTVVNPMLNSLGKNPNQGNQLVQFGGSFNSLGATLAPVIVGGLLGGSASTIASANPVFFLAMGIFLAAFLVIFFSKLPESPDLGKPQARVKVSGAFRYRNFTFGVLAIFCYVGLEVGLANWTYQYLEKSELVVVNNVGFEAAALAGTVVGIYWLLMLVGRLLGGVVGSKISSRAMLVTAALGAMLFIVLGIFTEENFVPFIGFDSKEFAFSVVNIPLNAIFFVLCGLFASIMWGAIFNLSVTGLGKYTAVASGIFMVMVCGGGIFPAIQSVLASGSILGSFWLPFALAAYILVYAMVLSRPSKNLPEEAEVLVEE
ncbi:MAG TPA: MFS transporter [Porphyromonadaceae bacterium]|jgi:FHS family L-fucose permease-like MFS transporter|nr:MFS transporter [Muribaculaceae bacterium Isolate-013 (NCI)]HAP29289.1 MFS transporter [Porphyromonadaceae bacterium]